MICPLKLFGPTTMTSCPRAAPLLSAPRRYCCCLHRTAPLVMVGDRRSWSLSLSSPLFCRSSSSVIVVVVSSS